MSEGINKDSTNVLIIGKSGVGKSSLLNYIFGRELQKVGVGAPVTKMEIKKFTYKYDDHFEMHIYDTWGLEPSVQKAEDWKKTWPDLPEYYREGDTLYLAACTKGSRAGAEMRQQPKSKELAPQRAYSIKSRYVNTIILDSLKHPEMYHDLFVSEQQKNNPVRSGFS